VSFLEIFVVDFRVINALGFIIVIKPGDVVSTVTLLVRTENGGQEPLICFHGGANQIGMTVRGKADDSEGFVFLVSPTRRNPLEFQLRVIVFQNFINPTLFF
jgi:hypothetical protein